MKRTKVIAIMVTALLSVSAVVYASVGSRTATLFYNNIRVVLDGKEIIPKDANGNSIEPFTIEGTTYLPVRGISSALGLEVAWNSETKTVELNTPGAFSGAVEVYDDDNVTIEFAGCSIEKPYSFSDTVYYYANFNVKNKTDVELTFQTDSLSFNGISYNKFLGSDEVAPQSSGKISFYRDEPIPVSGINKTSGQIRVIDFSYEFLENSYEAKWVNVKQ